MEVKGGAPHFEKGTPLKRMYELETLKDSLNTQLSEIKKELQRGVLPKLYFKLRNSLTFCVLEYFIFFAIFTTLGIPFYYIFFTNISFNNVFVYSLIIAFVFLLPFNLMISYLYSLKERERIKKSDILELVEKIIKLESEIVATALRGEIKGLEINYKNIYSLIELNPDYLLNGPRETKLKVKVKEWEIIVEDSMFHKGIWNRFILFKTQCKVTNTINFVLKTNRSRILFKEIWNTENNRPLLVRFLPHYKKFLKVIYTIAKELSRTRSIEFSCINGEFNFVIEDYLELSESKYSVIQSIPFLFDTAEILLEYISS